MPIVASRGAEIRKRLGELSDPRTRPAAILRLRALGSRVVPHVAEALGRLDPESRRALLEVLQDVDTGEAKTLRRRLARVEAGPPVEDLPAPAPETAALLALRALPPPRETEKAAVTRARGEAHLALARAGSRLARKELLLTLGAAGPDRARLYCDAAGLIGDADFLTPLARLAATRPEAAAAIAAIARRERITARSKALRALDPDLRPIVARALAGG